MKAFTVLTVVLLMSVSFASAQETDALRHLQAEQKLLRSTVKRLRKLVEELQGKTVALDAENARLKKLLEKAGIDPKKGDDVAVNPAEPAQKEKAAPVKTYRSIAAILAEVPLDPPAKPREWNQLTITLHNEWLSGVNQWLSENMQAKRLSTAATIRNIGLEEDVLTVTFSVPIGATSFKGVKFMGPYQNAVKKTTFTIELERNDDTVSTFAPLKSGDTCKVVVDVERLKPDRLWFYNDGSVGLSKVVLQIGDECTLSGFKQIRATRNKPPTTVRIRRRPEGGGVMYIGKVR